MEGDEKFYNTLRDDQCRSGRLRLTALAVCYEARSRRDSWSQSSNSSAFLFYMSAILRHFLQILLLSQESL